MPTVLWGFRDLSSGPPLLQVCVPVLGLPEAQSLSKRQRMPAPLLLVLKDWDRTRKALFPKTGNA